MSGQKSVFEMMFGKPQVVDTTSEEPAEKEVGPTRSRSTQAYLDSLKVEADDIS